MKKWLDKITGLFSKDAQHNEVKSPQAKGVNRESLNQFGDDLSEAHQRLFAALSQFVWIQGEPIPLIFDLDEAIYTEKGITRDTLQQLEACGLIHFEPGGFVKKKLGKHTRLFYCGRATKIGFSEDMDNQLDLGHVLLTDYGKSLISECHIQMNQAFYEYVIRRWYQSGYMVATIQINQKNNLIKAKK